MRSCSVELVPGAAGEISLEELKEVAMAALRDHKERKAPVREILGPTKRAISTTHNSAAQSSVDSGKSVSNRSSRLPFKFRVLREESSK